MREIPHFPVALYEVAVLFGALVAETILASVHVRAHKQAGHMDASDLIKALQNTLQGGGRPHMGNHAEVWFARDSPLEGSGFEPSVPLPRLSSIRAVRAEIIGRSTDAFRRDREFDVSAVQGRLSTSSQNQCSTDRGLIAGTWHRPLFLTRDRWFESTSLQRGVCVRTGDIGNETYLRHR